MSDIGKTVQEIYAAFGRGDVPAILGALHPDVVWEYGQGPTNVPYLQPRHGRDGVGGFFAALGQNLRLDRFEVRDVLVGKDVVVALVAIEGVALTTGRRVAEEDEVHIWRFGPDGRVVRFRHALDVLQHERALAA